MANDTYYDLDNFGIWWCPEYSYGCNDNGDTQNVTANDAGDAFYPFPGPLRKVPVFFLKKNRVYERVANIGPDFGYIADHGYHEGKVSLSMGMNNFSMLYYLCGACTTTDDTPGAGQYTHVYATTTARASAPKSFGILMKMTNADTNHTITRYFTGCVLKACKLASDSAEPPGAVTVELEILFANCVAGTALTDYTAQLYYTNSAATGYALRNFTHADCTVTYAKGGTSYYGTCEGWTIEYDDGKLLHRPSGQSYASEALNGERTIKVSLKWNPMSKNHIDDTMHSPLAAATASDVDITVTIVRTASTDQIAFAFEKLWCVEAGEPDWALFDRYLQHNAVYIIKPAVFETGAKLTVTEVNALNDDRYET